MISLFGPVLIFSRSGVEWSSEEVSIYFSRGGRQYFSGPFLGSYYAGPHFTVHFTLWLPWQLPPAWSLGYWVGRGGVQSNLYLIPLYLAHTTFDHIRVLLSIYWCPFHMSRLTHSSDPHWWWVVGTFLDRLRLLSCVGCSLCSVCCIHIKTPGRIGSRGGVRLVKLSPFIPVISPYHPVSSLY